MAGLATTDNTHQSSCKIEFQSSQFFSMHKVICIANQTITKTTLFFKDLTKVTANCHNLTFAPSKLLASEKTVN